jgi:formylglycine-generating enzyme required for sulfatase activity
MLFRAWLFAHGAWQVVLGPLIAIALLAPARRVDPLSGIAFSLVPAGSFRMGTPAAEPQRELQERLHRVTLSHAFYIGVNEVTERQWTQVMGVNPSHFSDCPDCPVERVTFFDVQAFIARLNASSPWPGFRLPTEAEWEYACRAGGKEAYGASATVDRSRDNYDGTKTMPVGSFPANAFGLHDMSGNVWEWTSDDHCAYADSQVTNPTGTCASGLKVIRGGSWRFAADSARCGLRYTHRPQDPGYSLGVRLAHDAE